MTQVLIEVAERYQTPGPDGEPVTRARWRWFATQDLTNEEASELVHQLRDKHGAARATAVHFEIVALRNSFGLQLIEPNRCTYIGQEAERCRRRGGHTGVHWCLDAPMPRELEG